MNRLFPWLTGRHSICGMPTFTFSSFIPDVGIVRGKVKMMIVMEKFLLQLCRADLLIFQDPGQTLAEKMANVLFTLKRGNANKKVREVLAYCVIMEHLRKKKTEHSLWRYITIAWSGCYLSVDAEDQYDILYEYNIYNIYMHSYWLNYWQYNAIIIKFFW